MMLHVVENLAVIQGRSRSLSKPGVGLLLVFHSNYVLFLRYSVTNNGMPLKPWLGFI